jgi:hypothetical protein
MVACGCGEERPYIQFVNIKKKSENERKQNAHMWTAGTREQGKIELMREKGKNNVSKITGVPVGLK